MNEEKVTREATETWRWTDWGEEFADCVVVRPPGTSEHSNRLLKLRHESEIREHWSERVKARIRAEVRKHRPLDDDEFRDIHMVTWRFRERRGDLQCTVHGDTDEGWIKATRPDILAAARAWFERNKPTPKLASNQVLAEDETSPIELRWHEGAPEARYAGENGPWFTWKLGGAWCKAADAWFRANCPIDRFVTDSGAVLEFRMRDDGEAQCDARNMITISGGPSDGCASPALRALYRFRDAERAKWTFELNKEDLKVRHDGNYRGYLDDDGPSPDLQTQPTWVRSRAEKMWQEKEPKWTVRWNPTAKPSNTGAVELLEDGHIISTFFNSPKLFPRGCPLDMQEEAVRVWNEHNPEWRTEWDAAHQRTKVMKGDGCYGHIRRDSESQSGPIPPHILVEARAKFRENYVLARNEVWQRGEVVRLTWDASAKTVRLSDGHAWTPGSSRYRWCVSLFPFLDEAERITAYNRCQEFYCENAEDAYLWKRGLLEFLMVGDIGHAKIGTSTVWTSDHPNSREYPEEEFRGREKLIRWTYKQLAARKVEKVAFRASGIELRRNLGEPDTLHLINPQASDSELEKFHSWPRAALKVTIEPAGEK